MDAEKRVSFLLKLAEQHMQRFREIEGIEWRINFSVWAFWGALAYLWINGHICTPEWMKSCAALIFLPVGPAFLQSIAILEINKMGKQHAKLRDEHRSRALEEMGIRERIYGTRRKTVFGFGYCGRSGSHTSSDWQLCGSWGQRSLWRVARHTSS